ncbi:MAG: hypothetical protein ACXWPK_20875 [Isosphaeraceae bacterium]
MTSKAQVATKASDVELLQWWREWLKALDAEMSAENEREHGLRHTRVEVIQRTIAQTPSQGLMGIGVKLALASFLDGFAGGADGEPGRSAYLDTLRMLDRDFLAEAEAVLERSRERETA